MISLKRRFSYASYYYLVYLGCFVLLAAVCYQLVGSAYRMNNLPVQDYAGYRCKAGDNKAGPTFRFLDAVYQGDTELVDALCASPVFADSYTSIEMQRVQRDELDLRGIYELEYGLLLAKAESMARASVSGLPAYQLIAQYPAYGSQLIALEGIPQLTRDYFAGKTLGLLDDPNSLSSYQIPKAALRKHQLDATVLDIIYFKSHRQLYQALVEGEVDVIAFLLTEDSVYLPEGLELARDLPGAGWYLHPDLYHTPLHCELLDLLLEVAANTSVTYLQRLEVKGACNEA